MQILRTFLRVVRWAVTVIWGGLGLLAIIGYFTQVGDGLRARGLRSFVGNAMGLLVVFVAPLSVVTLAARKLR